MRRLGDLEWFEIAYRVYLTALVGGLGIAWLSDLVADDPVSRSGLTDVNGNGPALLGLFAVAAVALGLRSGSDGGPVSLEAGDVHHLLMAPVPRRTVLLRPLVQRGRSLAFSGAVIGLIAGQLAARRLPGSAPAWAASGAAGGALIALAFVATATIAHATGLSRALATAAAAAVIAAQVAALVWHGYGPGNGIGSLAMWGMRTNVVDLLSVAAVLVAVAVALVLVDRLRVEPLTRRADLVSQLRFAVTMQDLRTVVLLRRQLRGERPRQTPWLRLRRSKRLNPTLAVWQRDLRGLARYPASRLVRMSSLAIAAALCAAAAESGTTPALVGVGVSLYLLGLDAIEPMSQEIDHPDHSDGVPRSRGWLLVRHLASPAMATVPFALLGAALLAVIQPDHAAASFALCIPLTWAGVCGSVVSVVRDAPDPLSPSATSTAVPPEFAGFTSSINFLIPLVVSMISTLTVLGMRADPTAGSAVRFAILDALVVAATGTWVFKRDAWRKAWRELLDAGRKT